MIYQVLLKYESGGQASHRQRALLHLSRIKLAARRRLINTA
jgi:hypothetical protein